MLGVSAGQTVSTTLILHCNIVITWISLISSGCSWIQKLSLSKRNTFLKEEVLGNLAFQACMEFPVYLSIVKASWAVDKEYWKMSKKLFLFAEAQLPQPGEIRKY